MIPSQVPAVGLPRSRPDRTHGRLGRSSEAKAESKVCHCAGSAGRSRYSSRLDARILGWKRSALGRSPRAGDVGGKGDGQLVAGLRSGVEDDTHARCAALRAVRVAR